MNREKNNSTNEDGNCTQKVIYIGLLNCDNFRSKNKILIKTTTFTLTKQCFDKKKNYHLPLMKDNSISTIITNNSNHSNWLKLDINNLGKNKASLLYDHK